MLSKHGFKVVRMAPKRDGKQHTDELAGIEGAFASTAMAAAAPSLLFALSEQARWLPAREPLVCPLNRQEEESLGAAAIAG